MRVCIFVLNDCTVDSRILRQASTFSGAGHETIIVAVQRGDVPYVENRDGFQIRRVYSRYNWREGYPRLIGRPARLLGRGIKPWDLDELNRTQQAARQFEEPATTVEEEIAPENLDPIPRLSPEGWMTWIRTGEPPHPRSWTRGTRSTRSDRLRHVWDVSAGSPGFVLRRIYRLLRKLTFLGIRGTKRLVLRGRRLLIRKLLLPTRFRQLDRRMAAEAVRFRADLYWANDVTTVRSAYAAARKNKARVVYDAHEVIWDAPTVAPLQRRLWGLVERAHVKKVHRVSTVCDPIAREMAERYGIDEPIVILNCPRLTDTARAGTRESSPINDYRKPGETIVLFHGSLSPWRGLEQLLQSLTFLPETYRLVVLGHGIFRETLEELAAKESVAGRVTFLHSVPPAVLPSWLAGADLGLIPYQRHGRNHEYSTPNKLFEYMHVGVPILVNDLPEIRRIVTEVGYGLICDCSDPAAIAKGIQDVMSDPDRYERMRRNALAAASTYSWEGQEHKILDALG